MKTCLQINIRSILLILTGLLLLYETSFSQSADSAGFKSLPPGKFRNSMESSDSALLIDVREYFEYKKSRIDHAVNIPSSGNIEMSADTLNNRLALYLYCTTGFRSKRVAKQFAAMGFENVINLDGGINAWKKEGFPVNKKKLKKAK